MVSTAIAWRSPLDPLPPSIGAFSGTAYGPGIALVVVGERGRILRSACPGTVMNGMPIGPPSQMPAPKSAWKPLVAPMVVTIEAEFASTGSVSTGVFQMLLAGSTGQAPIVGCA